MPRPVIPDDKRQKEYPKLPRPVRAALMRHAGEVGGQQLAKRIGMVPSNLFRLLSDPNARVRQTTIDRMTSALMGDQPSSATPQQQHGMPSTDAAFTLRVVLTIKEAERLTAHCDLKNVTPSRFVADVVRNVLDSEWGKE